MNTTTVFRDMDTLSKNQRIQFAMDVWDHALSTGAVPDLTVQQKTELQSRMLELDTNPTDVFSWDETKQYLNRQT